MDIRERPYLNLDNLNMSTFEDMRNKQMNSKQFQTKMIRKACNDDKVIMSILNLDSFDNSFLSMKSELKDKMDFLKDDHNDLDGQLKEYIRYLTGVSNQIDRKARVENMFKNYLFVKFKGIKDIEDYYAKQFDLYVEEEQNVLKDIAENLEEKVKYSQVYKDSNREIVRELFDKDPKYHWFRICSESYETVLPVLHYVFRKTLCLKSYTLSIGHAKALAKACELFEHQNINRVIFDNCGIDDDEFSEILSGIQKLKDFKKIIYRYNIFHRKSLK